MRTAAEADPSRRHRGLEGLPRRIRRQRSSATVRPFCLTFSQRLVGPPSSALVWALATYPSYPRSITCRHASKPSGVSRRTAKINSLLSTPSSRRARRSRSGRLVRSRTVLGRVVSPLFGGDGRSRSSEIEFDPDREEAIGEFLMAGYAFFVLEPPSTVRKEIAPAATIA